MSRLEKAMKASLPKPSPYSAWIRVGTLLNIAALGGAFWAHGALADYYPSSSSSSYSDGYSNGGSYSNYRPSYSAPVGKGPLLSLEMDGKKILNVDFRVAARSERIEDVKRLLKAGADVNSQSESGETALMYASRQCSVETVHLLLGAHARLNVRDAMGRNALMYAVMESCEAVVHIFLKESNLELGAVDESNRNVFDYSIEETNAEVDGPAVEILRLLKRAEYLHPLSPRHRRSAEARPAQVPHS
jgi:hypothetical protein